ncbi:MAG TPA: PilX N-terminal domain-containing pilus assembly protein [Candidatus Angelobacter sp.]|jgi:Tfp pilus assembly protein PilX|nr:PilX N-terminal domain-containing pilus assembly protein [Candidatus Angelobacter sp.]
MKTNKKYRRSERGIALMIAIISVLLVTAVGVGMIFMSNLESNISANFRDEQVAFFASRAGIEEIRDRLRASAVNSLSASLPSALPGASNGVLYVLNPTGTETVAPWTSTNAYADTEICSEVTCVNGVPAGTPWYTTTTSSSSYAATPTLTWKWARITVKTNKTSAGRSVDGTTTANRVCWASTSEVVTALGNCGSNTPVYVVTALAITPSGTRRMVQAELSPTNPIANMPAALVMDGTCAATDTSICFGTPHSANYGISGQDMSNATNLKPAIGVLNSTSQTIIDNALFRPANYTGATGTPPVLGSPAVSVLQPSDLGTLNTVQGVQDLSDALQSASGCNSSPIPSGCVNTTVNMSPSTNPPITFINGDWSNCNGTGILVVTGTLTCSGNTSYNGLIFVIGQGHLVGNGGGNGAYTGAIFIAKTKDTAGHQLSTLGEPIYDWNGGGGNGLTFDGSWTAKLAGLYGYKVIAFHELMN